MYRVEASRLGSMQNLLSRERMRAVGCYWAKVARSITSAISAVAGS